MSWQPVKFESQLIGHELRTDEEIFFFGNHWGSLDHLKRAYPELQFHRLKQVHGDEVLEVQSPSEGTLEADAHFTDRVGLALVIQTADCMPLLAANKTHVLAVHSGWRGTQKNIIEKSLVKAFSPNRSPARIFVGPFIQGKSFEVSLDLAVDFEKMFPGIRIAERHLNLGLAAKYQILASKVPLQEFAICLNDTMTEDIYASYRRAKEQALRNISFVARLK